MIWFIDKEYYTFHQKMEAPIGYIDKEYYCATFIQLHSEILSILNTH